MFCVGAGRCRRRADAQTKPSDDDLDRQFQAAVAQYDAGHFAEAAVQLEKLLPSVPESFEVHELARLVYSAQSQDAKASEHLEKAVRLNPKSAAAQNQPGRQSGAPRKTAPAEEQFRKAVELEPENFDANHNLGEAYVRSGKIADAAPFLEKAQRIDRIFLRQRLRPFACLPPHRPH